MKINILLCKREITELIYNVEHVKLFEWKNAQLEFESAFLHPICSNIHLISVILHYIYVFFKT